MNLNTSDNMEKINSLSDKRIIITAKMNGRDAKFLIDTGATVGVISRNIQKKYGLSVGRKFPKPLVGAGGEFDAFYCNTPAYICNRPITQFLLADISGVVESVKSQTGMEIQGIISLAQMRMVGMTINTNDNTVTVA